MEWFIFRNRARCLKCSEIIESTHVHESVTCSCGSLTVDGGTQYLKRSGDPEQCQELSVTFTSLEEKLVQELLSWQSILKTLPQAIAYTLLEYKDHFLTKEVITDLIQLNFQLRLSKAGREFCIHQLERLHSSGILEGQEVIKLSSEFSPQTVRAISSKIESSCALRRS